MSCLLETHQLGKMDYKTAHELQRRYQQEVIAQRGIAGSCPFKLLLVEHSPPVITISRRASASQNLLASESELQKEEIQICKTDRGGDITYHGPGQLVAYPIFDLNALSLRLHGYMRFLEGIVIDVLAEFSIQGQRDACATGVWVEGAKICAMGVRVSRWVSMHGFALNIEPNMAHFNTIVPCGLAGRKVTSMQELLENQCPSLEEVQEVIIEKFELAIARQDRVQQEHHL